MNGELSYVLWLPSWYPNRIAPYAGDFIQRHARAVAAFTPVHIIHVVKDDDNVVTNNVFIEEKKEGNLTEIIIYFSAHTTIAGLFKGFFSHQKQLKLYRRHLRKIFKEKGFPSLVHTQVAYKAGLIARWIRKRYGVSYLLTEHWTVYLNEARHNFNSLSFAAQYMISKIINDAELILPVSEYLADAMKLRWPNSDYETVPNVADISVFYPAAKRESVGLKLIHISSLTYQKDPETLFKAMGIVKSKGISFTLDVFGPVTGEIKKMIEENKVEDAVILHGETPQTELAPVLQQSDALILYSRYETFGCVIIEANACGVPVIVPDTSLMRELVKDGVNGILVPPHKAEALADALINFADHRQKFKRNEIAATATSLYSFGRVGNLYADIYNRFLQT